MLMGNSMEVSTQAVCSAHEELNVLRLCVVLMRNSMGAALSLHVVLMRNSMEVSTQAACSTHEELNGGEYSGCM